MIRSRLSSGIFFTIFTLAVLSGSAQLVSGPMLGHTELRTARIWVEVKPGSVTDCWYWKTGEPASVRRLTQTAPNAWFTPLIFDLVNLELNTGYEYAVRVNDRSGKAPATADGSFHTDELWQWRKPAPDFSFLTGSCFYANEPVYDRPGPGYGKDSSIFDAMAKEKAAFMLWLGDNWYLREADYFSAWGIWYRANHARSLPVLQPFLKAMPHYAIWDDHDYGPNDGDRSFPLKEESRKVFMNYWTNPSFGYMGEGIYTKISKSDCDFFLMDDRSFRSPDDMAPFIDGKANPEKRMWGVKQMEWLKSALVMSKAPFKFIVTGSQVLNPVSPYDCMQDYPFEFQELLQFLQKEKVNGVLFLTGDRHHSEIIRFNREGAYPLYDITSSPLTSGTGIAGGKEKDNPFREPKTLVEAQNYSRITVSGKQNDRTLKVEFLGIKGELITSWSVSEKALKQP